MQEALAQITWYHNIALLAKLDNPQPRLWFTQKMRETGWSHNVLVLQKENNMITVEYALRDLKKPIGVAAWRTRLVESLPKRLKGQLPTIEQIEKELENA